MLTKTQLLMLMPSDDIAVITAAVVHFILWIQCKFTCDVTILILCDSTPSTRGMLFELALKFKPFVDAPPVNWSHIVRVCECLYDLDQSIRYRKIRMCTEYDNRFGINPRTKRLYRAMFYRTCNVNKPAIRQYSLLPPSKRDCLLSYLSMELKLLDMF